MGLVAWGETHIDSSVAGIAQSTVPIFTFILAARFLPHEHVGPLRIAGVALGFLGVAALTGLDTAGGWWVIAGTLAVVLSSLSYASGGVYGQLQVRDIPGPVLATGSMLAAALVLAPLALADPPTRAARDDRARRPRRPDPHPDLRRPAPPLPGAAPAREPQALDRDVPHARVRCRVRRRPARRVGDSRDARRVRAHRGWRCARIRTATLRRARAGVAPRDGHDSPRDAGRRGLPRRARDARGRGAVPRSRAREGSRRDPRGDRAHASPSPRSSASS